MSQSVCFYFQVHQPYRISTQSLLHGTGDNYFSTRNPALDNQLIFEKVAEKSYLPMTSLMLGMIEQHPDIKFSFALSGVFIEQCLEFGAIGTKVLKNFQALAKTNNVEFLAETYGHSLAFLYSKKEYAEQIKLHRDMMINFFDQKPRVFRNTELIYRDDLAAFIHQMGYTGMLAEGWDAALPDDHPNHVHWHRSVELPADDFAVANAFSIRTKNNVTSKTKLSRLEPLAILSKNYKLSDDMAFRFGNPHWPEFPLDSATYAQWIYDCVGETVNLFMDFETFGEHQWADTGIFEFFEHLPIVFAEKGIEWRTPSETIFTFEKRGEYQAEDFVSWADEARDISAWVENDMQRAALLKTHEIEQKLNQLGLELQSANDDSVDINGLWLIFRKLTTSDHLYYMSTKFWADGDVHTYFSPYENPYEAYINFMNVLEHFAGRLDLVCPINIPQRSKIRLKIHT